MVLIIPSTKYEGTPSSCTSANKLLLPAECQITGSWGLPAFYNEVSRVAWLTLCISLSGSICRLNAYSREILPPSSSGWHLQVIDFLNNFSNFSCNTENINFWSRRSLFITMTIVSWIDVFTRKNHKLLIKNSLKFCQQNKRLIISLNVIFVQNIIL